VSDSEAAAAADTADESSAWWSTALTEIQPGVIRLRGYPIEQLIGGARFCEVIWLLLRGELPEPDDAALLELALVAAVDHGPQAPSIAAARMAATCGVGINNAVATGVNLLGDVHGGAGQQCMQLLDDVRSTVASAADRALPDVVAEVIEQHRSQQRFLPGFGHRFHPRDPRRDPLLHAVERHVAAGRSDGTFLAVALEIERQLASGRDRPLPMNIDGATAVVYSELGFEPELGRGLFVLSRSVGILAHTWEERQQGSRLKGPLPQRLLPLYQGPGRRDVPER